MKFKTVAIFIVSVAICTLAATCRFYDSAHVMGTIRKGGGLVRHPALLSSGKGSYTLIATATVIPPYRGNVRVALEGSPVMPCEIYDSRPAVVFGIHHRPVFRDNTFYDLRPKDHIAAWIRIQPAKGVDHHEIQASDAKEKGLCPRCGSDDVMQFSQAETVLGKGRPRSEKRRSGGLSLTFRDTESGELLLGIPVVFKGKGGKGHDS